MGLETKCTLRVGRENVAGVAHLDTDRLTFRGAVKLNIGLATIQSAEVKPGGQLRVIHGKEIAVLGFGDRATAEKWMLKIRYPKSLIDKLGVKTGSRVAVLGVTEADFLRDLRERLGGEPGATLATGLDFIFYAADSTAELAKLKSLRKFLQPAGAIWVVSVKGRAAAIRDTDVMRAAGAADLVDVKVCSFSAAHTALKLVIPKGAR